LFQSPVERAVLLAYVFKVDVAVAMNDLVPVEVTVEINDVATVNETVKLAAVAANGGQRCGACGCGYSRNYRACCRYKVSANSTRL
jgi:hypothetical protein